MTAERHVSAIVLAYGDEPHLADCIASLLTSTSAPEIIVVDNGAHAAVAALPNHSSVRVVRPAGNLGFSGGCNYGVRHATGDVLVFVNSDATVELTAPARLAATLEDNAIGLVSAKVLLASEPENVNSVGNPVNYLCFSWAGSLGDRSSDHETPCSIAGVSGATFAIRRAVWDELGGFDDHYFAYCEDMDLSLRAWQRGYTVTLNPSAVSWHWHEFSRNPQKMYLLERNRLITLLTIYERATLLRIAPAVLAVELGVMVAAFRDGWARQKLRGWWWLAANRRYLRERRRAVQGKRTVDDRVFAGVLQARIEPPPGFGMAIPAVVNRVLEIDWTLTRRRMDRRRTLDRAGRREIARGHERNCGPEPLRPRG